MCVGGDCSKWTKKPTADAAWTGVDPTTGLTGTGTYLVTENCTYFATEDGTLIEAWA